MPTIRTAASKGSPLTPTEADANMKRTVTAVTSSSFTLDGTHNRDIIECQSGAATLNLTAVATLDNEDTGDWFVDIKNTLTTSITVDGSGSETIDGATTLVIPAGQSVRIALDQAKTGFTAINKPLSSLRAVIPSSSLSHTDTGNWQSVVFSSATYDHLGAYNTTTGLFTLPTGYNFFKINCILSFNSNATGQRGVSFATGTTSGIIDYGNIVNACTSGITIVSLSTGWIPRSVASSGYILGLQSSGGNLVYNSSSRLYIECK